MAVEMRENSRKLYEKFSYLLAFFQISVFSNYFPLPMLLSITIHTLHSYCLDTLDLITGIVFYHPENQRI